MTLIKANNKYVVLLIIIFVGSLYFLGFITSVQAKLYHKEFAKDTFKKIEIEITHNFSSEIVQVQVIDKNEINYYSNLFANNLNYNERIKERKLYYYSVFLKFYNLNGTNVYFYKVFFDKEKIKIRPVALRSKGNESKPGGYPFALEDETFEFHERIMEIWKTSKKSHY